MTNLVTADMVSGRSRDSGRAIATGRLRGSSASNASANALAWLALAFLGFASTAIIYRVVGAELYGVWATVVAIKGFALLLEGGLAFAAMREAARVDDDAEATPRLRATYTLSVLLGIAVVTVGVLVARLPATLLGLTGTEAQVATVAMILVAIEAGITIGASGLYGALRGRGRFDLWAVACLISAVIGISLVVIVVPTWGIVGAAAALLVGRMTSLGLTLVLVRRTPIFPRLSRDLVVARKVAAFVGPLWLVALGSGIGMGTDVLIVGFFFGAIASGEYALGAVIPAVAASLLFALIDTFLPRFASQGDASSQQFAIPLVRAASLLAALGFGVIAAETDVLLRVWTGSAPALAITVGQIYALVWTLNVPVHVLVLLLIGSNRHAFLGPFVCVEAAFGLALSLLFAASGAPEGPALATLLVVVVSNVVVLPILATSRLRMPRRPLVFSVATGYVIGGLGAAAVIAIARLAADDAIRMALAATLTVLLAAVLLETLVRRPQRWRGMLLHGGWRVYLRQRSEAHRARAQIDASRALRPKLWIQGTPPLVTVRIATYNRGPLVAERAIASAQAQTYPNLEILVVGDHCDEATANAVMSVKDKRLRFVNLPSRGVYPTQPERRWMVAGEAPMNHALDIATGAWLAPLDDDDEFTPDHVEILLDACRDQALDFAYGVARMEVREGVWETVGSWPLRLGQIIHASVLYSMDLRILRHDVDSWRLHEPGDWNLWHRMRDAGARMGFVDHVVVNHYLERRELR